MRNINLYKVEKQYTGLSDVVDLLQLNDKIYVIRGTEVWCQNVSNNCTSTKIGECLDLVSKFQFLTLEEAVVFSTSDSVNFINIHNNDISKFDLDSKIICTSWNPSQEHLAIIFEDGDIGLFTFNLKDKNFDVVESCNLDFECPESISVGWGSTKTQFRGPLKKKTDDVLTLISNVLIYNEDEIEPPSIFDDKKPIITWRADGEMFAVSYWKNSRRNIKFFNRECEPLFENSGVNGLQPILSWRPFGADIASISVIKNSSFLVMFEKNATVRHEYELEHQYLIQDLKWDQSGNFLATYLKIQEENKTQIRIYLIRNNHLYLKQTLPFNTSDIINFKWFESSPLAQYLSVSLSNYIIKYRFRLVVDKMYNKDFNCTIVGVIDGSKLYLCRHSQSDCCSYENIVLEEPINSVVFKNNSALVPIFGLDNFYLYKYKNVEENPQLVNKVQLSDKTLSLQMFNVSYISDHKLQLKIVHLNDEINMKTSEFDIEAISKNEKTALIYLDDKSEDELSNVKIICRELLKTDKGDFDLSLDEYRNVYLNSKLIWSNITSFTVHNSYLFLTTKDSLIGIRLNSVEDFYNQKQLKLYTRTIDMGSVLICGMGSTSNLILQAPRGNIEIISCLLINIDNIDRYLENNNWKEAWDTVRLLKLNSNLLFDLNPNRFLSNIDKFIEVAVLTVFLSELEEDNVFVKVYTTSGYNPLKFDKKVETVCKKIIEFLVENNYVESLTSIVHACLIMRSSKFPIKEALKHVQTLFRYNSHDDNIKKSVDDAIKFMLKYVHVKDAYQAALSLYDLELAILIARHSEMDPQEYIDFINKLKNYSQMYRNYVINDYLGSYNMAICYLYEEFVNCDSDKILQYMNKHNLQKELYDNISEKSPIYYDVVKSYAEKLSVQKYNEEAGLILEKAKLYADALESYKQSNNWRKAIQVMTDSKMDRISFKDNIREIANNLISVDKVEDASYLYEMFLGDYENAIKFLTEKHRYTLAYDIAKKHSRLDIVETTIEPALQQFTSYMVSELQTLSSIYIKYRERLFTVRKEKLEKFKRENDKDFDENCQTNRGIEDDLYSLAGSTTSTKYGSSVTSNSSRSSTASSRSRRKEQRKKENLREGGPYEDIALMKVLHEKISQVSGHSDMVRDVCILLFQLNMRNKAIELHNSLLDLQSSMKHDLKEIWPDYILKHDEFQSDEYKVLKQNLLHLDPAYWKPPVIKSDWVVNILKN